MFSDENTVFLRNVYLPGIIEADARGHTYNPLKTRDFAPFSKY